MVKSCPKNSQVEGNENQFEKIPSISVDIPISRTPLDTIPDPSQFSKEFIHEVLNQSGIKDKLLDAGVGAGSSRRKFDLANSTPARSVSRTNVGQLGACTGPRVVQSTGERGGGVSRVSRRISSGNGELVAAEVPHFELVEDPSFWDDHNVQVLIRMRPLSNMEKMAQGYSRCLKQESLQTLVWLGHPEVKFTFDHIVSETISQERLFSVAGLPMIDNCMSGYNSCMFAYGQTGSGKTYTMMGEIGQRDGKFVDDCGMTPRLFEYLFTRIKSEEESRRDERLKYSCKCSFLEIYNEQITDLLEPSSTNLQLREGLKEGVYVENLTEYNVETVDEVIKLLLQGAANRKVAGTDMNGESSRSHSVFTCIVESRWEKDSVTHLRFGRLNLVDLAGSERQRSSGAGERVKEASYINKSLSTLGLVIMSLVDVTHGKHRHVPYRDSRLTFLLQDSLGGNSKTTIIANVSPSMCAANETLSTLKFAQRAKLIQNNAKVNEDASGDVTALQRQIQMLKEQMFFLMKQQKISKPVFQGELCESEDSSGKYIYDEINVINDQKGKVETVLSSIDLGDEMSACNQVEDKVLLDNGGLERTNMLHTNLLEELMDARTLIGTMKSQQAGLIEELRYVRQENDRLVETLTNNNKPHMHPILDHESHISENQTTDQSMMGLQSRLDKMNKELEDLKSLNDPLKDLKDQVNLVHEEAENEATNAILNLQEELASLQVKYHRRLCTMSEENKKLKRMLAAKEDEVYALHSDWEKASLELTSFLLDGSKSLKDASGQIENVASSFAHNVCVGEHVKKAAMVIIEKEETILRLEKNLVDAQCTIQQMQEKLNSLRTATMALTEIQYNTEHDEKSKDEYQIIAELIAIRNKLENMMVYLSTIHDRSIFEDLDGSATDVSTSSSILSDDEDVLENMLVKETSSSHEPENALLLLKKQLVMAHEAFIKLDVQLAAAFKDKDVAACFTAKKFVEEQDCKASSFFSKCEEAHATMNEADNVLNALLKVNAEAQLSSVRWKQTAEDVMVEKASLVEEISQLRVDLQLRDEEHAILKVELENMVSMLEDSFQHLQKEADDLCQWIYSDSLAMVHGAQHIVCKSRSSLQDLCAEIMEKSFTSLVVQQCRIGEYINKFGLHDEKEENYSASLSRKETGDDLIGENVKLQKELERKTTLLNGLLFDFSLLQESASTRKDIKDEAEKLFTALSQVQHELKMKTDQLDDLIVGYGNLERRLTDTEAALSASKSCLQHSEETVDALSYQNAELRSLLEDLYLKTSETEKQLEEHKEMVKTLENEIHCATSSTQEHFLFSLEGITDDLKRVSVERDHLCEQVNSLQDKLEMAYAIADEKEAIAVEARQESQASKIYAEQKEEEVKILERSVEELDSTINMLEKRVNEMEEELERHHRIRDSLEVELQSLSQRLLTFESFRNGNDSNSGFIGQPEDQISRKLHSRYLELQEAHARIKDLEDERTEQANEIKQCKEYISELVIHAEAQASQYQQKYKSLEAMVRVMQMDSSKSVSEAPLTDKTEKSSVRPRGSSSPFRCIGNLVQQVNTEKDQELSLAKLHVEELEALVSNRQKEICMLNTKLATAESMTHDVIRDLLGVKLDMTNYANLINQNHLQRFIEDAAQQTQEFIAMEQEIRKLKRQINDLLEERDRCISELHSKEADILASKMTLMQLQGRDQLLTAQNEMLKADKTNLQRRAAELDDMIKKLLGTHAAESSSQQHENHMAKACSSSEFGRRLANSERSLLRVHNELAQYRKPDSSRLHHKMDEKRAR
ncbi:putative plus-end-directed kinesin ATPase [Helianthus annuus]|nr:putative plus-end-directed kinesin ATPase [Helianthus annuus]